MFQHEENEESEDEDNNEDDDDVNEDDVNKSREEENVISIDDIEPSLRNVEEAMEKVNALLKQKKWNCDVCEFEARNANSLKMHKKANRGNKQKNSSTEHVIVVKTWMKTMKTNKTSNTICKFQALKQKNLTRKDLLTNFTQYIQKKRYQ